MFRDKCFEKNVARENNDEVVVMAEKVASVIRLLLSSRSVWVQA